MKIKLTESQLKRVLKEVGGYDSPEVMATHAGPLHSVISSQTMELLMLVSKLAQGIRDEELSKSELTNGIYNLNHKISEYIKQMPDYVKEIYIDDDFKTVLKTFISALVKINKYFRMLVGSGQDQEGSFYTGLSFDMTQDELEEQVAEQIATLTDRIQEMGTMIMNIHQRFNDRTSSMNESDLKRIVKRVLTEQEDTYILLDTEWENNVPERVKVLSNRGFNDIEDKDAVEIMMCEGSVNRLPNLNAFPNLFLVNLLGCQPLIDIHVDSLINSGIARVLFNYVDTPTMNHKVNELIKRGEEKGMMIEANKVSFSDVPDGMLDGEALPAGAPLD